MLRNSQVKKTIVEVKLVDNGAATIVRVFERRERVSYMAASSSAGEMCSNCESVPISALRGALRAIL